MASKPSSCSAVPVEPSLSLSPCTLKGLVTCPLSLSLTKLGEWEGAIPLPTHAFEAVELQLCRPLQLDGGGAVACLCAPGCKFLGVAVQSSDGVWVCQFHIETIIIYNLSTGKFTTQNDICK